MTTLATISKEALANIDAATGSNVYDAAYDGGKWMYEPTEAQNTLDHFVEASASYWLEVSADFERGEVGGLPFIVWAKVQQKKGDARNALTVIDFGDFRVSLKLDIRDEIIGWY